MFILYTLCYNIKCFQVKFGYCDSSMFFEMKTDRWYIKIALFDVFFLLSDDMRFSQHPDGTSAKYRFQIFRSNVAKLSILCISQKNPSINDSHGHHHSLGHHLTIHSNDSFTKLTNVQLILSLHPCWFCKTFQILYIFILFRFHWNIFALFYFVIEHVIKYIWVENFSEIVKMNGLKAIMLI